MTSSRLKLNADAGQALLFNDPPYPNDNADVLPDHTESYYAWGKIDRADGEFSKLLDLVSFRDRGLDLVFVDTNSTNAYFRDPTQSLLLNHQGLPDRAVEFDLQAGEECLRISVTTNGRVEWDWCQDI